MPKITIEVIQNGVVVSTYHPLDKDEARLLFYHFDANDQQYTQLTVGKRKYTIAQAKRYFGWNPELRG